MSLGWLENPPPKGFEGGIRPLDAKAWVNRVLEGNRIPTIWITNDARIDPAYLRRFDYSVEMGIPPHSVRRQIVQNLVGEHVSDTAALDALADLDDLVPAQLERAAKVVDLAALPEEPQRWAGVVQALERSRALLGQKRRPIVASETLPYSLNHLNADTDLQVLTEGLRRNGRGSLCLYGPPGAGKTGYGQWLARTLNKPLLIKHAQRRQPTCDDRLYILNIAHWSPHAHHTERKPTRRTRCPA